MLRHSSSFIVALVLIAAGAGCATLRNAIEPPTLQLSSLQIVDAGLAQQRYRLGVKVHNPNPVALPVSSVRYRIMLENEEFVSGATSAPFQVPARGEAEFDVYVTTNLLRTLQRLGDWLEQGPLALNYRISGEMSLDNLLLRDVPFEREGEIQLSR